MDSSLGQHRNWRRWDREARQEHKLRKMYAVSSDGLNAGNCNRQDALTFKVISNSPAMDEGLGLHDIPSNSTSIFMGMSDVAGSHTWTHAGTIQGWAGGWGWRADFLLALADFKW